MANAQPTAPITWPGQQGELQGAWAQAANSKGAVLVIHENKGLDDWVRSVAGRLAGAGYSALAIDLLSEKGGTATFADPAQATAALGAIAPERFTHDLNSGIAELRLRAPGQKLGVLGFCFGGGLVWQLLADGALGVSAAAPFYGPLPDKTDFTGAKAAVLGIYGALDARVTGSLPAAKAALDRTGLVNDLIVEPNADHAFFNDTGPRYNPVAAADAWQRLLGWFGRHLGPQ
jgi:carboxymethylenebutenolidase